MKIFKYILLSFLLFVLFFAPKNVLAEGQKHSYVVRFSENTSGDDMRSALSSHNLNDSQVFDDLGIAVVNSTDETQVQSLTQSPNVEAVDLNHSMAIPDLKVDVQQPNPAPSPVDPFYLLYQWNIRRLHADGAWNLGYTSSHDTVVAIIDTGVASNHPDLGANIVYQACFTSFQTTCSPYPQIPSNMSGNHGTVVAGVLGSVINGAGLVGVAPNVGIANYNVSEYGPDNLPIVYDSSIWAAIQDAARHHFEIVNLSEGEILQTPLSSEDRERVNNWKRVINKAKSRGVVVVASGGNQGIDLDEPHTLEIPCELENVLCVGATNIRPQPVFPQPGFYDEAAFYTSYGQKIDFVAPGGDCGGPDLATCFTAPDVRYFIWSTTVSPNATCALTQSCPVSYTASIGTSFSAPEAAGVAALVMDAYRNRTGHSMSPDRVREVLRHTADPLPNVTLPLGAGMLNAEEAVKSVLNFDHEHDH